MLFLVSKKGGAEAKWLFCCVKAYEKNGIEQKPIVIVFIIGLSFVILSSNDIFQMKIIVVENFCDYNKTQANTLLNKDIAGLNLWMKADSALLKNNKPFFIPDFTEECSASVYLALRICRLGKSIPARFASRYYDAFGVVVDFTAEDVLRQLRVDGRAWDMAKSFDSSAVEGEFISTSEIDVKSALVASLEINGEIVSETVCEDIERNVGNVISAVSRVFTIRQGDLLLVGCPKSKPVVKIGDRVSGFLNGRKLLEFNVK